MVAGFVVFSFIWKNLEEKIARFQRSIEDGRIKKDPDTINKMEEERFARLERLQKELDEVNYTFIGCSPHFIVRKL